MKILAHDPRYKFNGREDSDSDAPVIREIWCENVYEVYDGDLSDTGIVVDIGANIGSFTLFAASLGAKKVIAVEPESHNLELLRQNIDEHQAITPDCEFIVDTNAVGGFMSDGYISNDHGDSRVTYQHAADAAVARNRKDASVKIITLEQLFKRHELEYIDVLKIDIEGREGEVLINAPERILNLCRYITLEYDQYANDLGAIVEKLNQTHQVKVVGKAGGMIFAKRY
jgi:FkbM family methyltransferase